MTVSSMKNSIIEQLGKILEKITPTYDKEILSFIVDGVMDDAIRIRNYPDVFNESMVENDLEKGMGIFKRVAMARYERIGVDGEKSHTEGNVNRSYVADGDLWKGWLPLSVIS